MRCVCGIDSQSKNVAALNQHRRTCNVFWQSIYSEMKRIAIETYGQPAPISQREWNRLRSPDFPSFEGLRKWAPPWTEIQQAAGLGVSSRGKGALALRGETVLGVADSNNAMDAIALTIHPLTVSPETYLAQTSRVGLPICEETYLRTGRMIVR
jgi:hypothetical protein